MAKLYGDKTSREDLEKDISRQAKSNSKQFWNSVKRKMKSRSNHLVRWK